MCRHDVDFFDRDKKHSERLMRLIAALRGNTTLRTLSVISEKSRLDKVQLLQQELWRKEALVFDKILCDLLKTNQSLTELDVQLGVEGLFISDSIAMNQVTARSICVGFNACYVAGID